MAGGFVAEGFVAGGFVVGVASVDGVVPLVESVK